MSKDKLHTHFAPAGRATRKTINRQKELLENLPLIEQLYSAVTDIVMILNKERQIIFFNQNLLEVLKAKESASLYGLRPGEAFDCVHARDCVGGCGTSKFCSTCGAARAILTSQEGKTGEQECRITQHTSADALDLLVKASPLKIGRESFTIFTLKDISHEKRRKALEQIFFHDILNTASYLQVASELLIPKDKEAKEVEEVPRIIIQGVSELLEEINSQKILTAAENHELVVEPVILDPQSVVEEVITYYKKLAEQKEVIIEKNFPPQNLSFQSDHHILFRVLSNMLKNAIESSQKEKVIVGYNISSNKIHFRIHNNAAIPSKVQLQLFQRSFSTKGSGRGLGTYSMKLLSERYLKGKISFTSSKTKGTTFVASYPLTVRVSS